MKTFLAVITFFICTSIFAQSDEVVIKNFIEKIISNYETPKEVFNFYFNNNGSATKYTEIADSIITSIRTELNKNNIQANDFTIIKYEALPDQEKRVVLGSNIKAQNIYFATDKRQQFTLPFWITNGKIRSFILIKKGSRSYFLEMLE